MSTEMEDQQVPTPAPVPAKWWADSQTIRGILMTLAPSFLAVSRALGFELFQGEVDTIINLIVAIIGCYGALMAIEGRLRAKTKLTRSNPE